MNEGDTIFNATAEGGMAGTIMMVAPDGMLIVAGDDGLEYEWDPANCTPHDGSTYSVR